MTSDVVVVMVPFVAQGHLNQLLHLSRLISDYDIPVHFVCTATHTRQARLRLHGSNSHDNLIRFHELPDPDFFSPPPNTNTTTQFPTHLQPSFNASLNLRGPAADIIRSLAKNYRRVAVVHDSAMSYVVQDVKTIPNAETYVFRALSVFFTYCSSYEKLGRELPFEKEHLPRLPKASETMSQEFIDFVKHQHLYQTFHVGNIYDSSRVMEGKFLESLERDEVYGKNHWAVGPFNPVEIPSLKQANNNIQQNLTQTIGTDNGEVMTHMTSISTDKERHTCLKWLDKQPEKSVIYVSFGTSTTFTEPQILELALGLEKSEQRFLWILRDADKGDVFNDDGARSVALPDGFEERVEGRGLVVREWAPQLEILGHLSVGGFVSHCGWNSSMEAMTRGVAIAAWPIHSDQPRNAFLLVDVLRVALMMREWTCHDDLVTSTVVEKVVRELMDTKEGAVIRQRAAELGGELRRSLAEVGVSRKELESLVSYMRR